MLRNRLTLNIIDPDPISLMSEADYNKLKELPPGGFSRAFLVTRKHGDGTELCLKETPLPTGEFVLIHSRSFTIPSVLSRVRKGSNWHIMK